MKKFTEEIRHKKANQTMIYSHVPSTKDSPLTSNLYTAKSRIEPSAPAATSNYYVPYLHFTNCRQKRTATYVRKEPVSVVGEVKSFMEEDEEEVSVGFEELMSEIAKYERGDKQDKNDKQVEQP